MDIRPALPAEAPALSALGARLFRETYGAQIPSPDLEAHIASAYHPAAQLAEIQGGLVLVAVKGGEFYAYAHARAKEAPCALPYSASREIARFYVDSRWHGTGLANRLMAASLFEAKGPVWLQVWGENPRALRFYVKQGFQDCGETTFQVGGIVYRDRVMIHG